VVLDRRPRGPSVLSLNWLWIIAVWLWIVAVDGGLVILNLERGNLSPLSLSRSDLVVFSRHRQVILSHHRQVILGHRRQSSFEVVVIVLVCNFTPLSRSLSPSISLPSVSISLVAFSAEGRELENREGEIEGDTTERDRDREREPE